MKWKGWDHVPLDLPAPDGGGGRITVDAIAPMIISASRSTDIPAFYGDWFAERLRQGWVQWKSPFGGKPLSISFAKARVFVFWSKNPAPFFPVLDFLDHAGYGYYFLFTLNDYDAEGLEPNVLAIEERIETFIRLSRRIGKGRVVWRFDPLILSDRIAVHDLLEKIRSIGDRLAPFTERLIFSFVDIGKYAKVRRNLQAGGFAGIREFTENEVREFCEGLAILNKRWGLSMSACAERRDLTAYGIERGQCISYDLLAKEFGHDPVLREFLNPGGQQPIAGTGQSDPDPSRRLRDPGQRNTCHCIVSKDIGQYSTCMHLCVYCYANTSMATASRNYSRYIINREHGVFHDTITD
jgi:DNA repair photolyase